METTTSSIIPITSTLMLMAVAKVRLKMGGMRTEITHAKNRQDHSCRKARKRSHEKRLIENVAL